MRANTEAARALAYFTAGQLDLARRHPEAARRQESQLLVDLLIPVVKAWSTDIGIAVADTGIQVHGGMGYIEETGAAQHLRDGRVAMIYEGTNGIQALDLARRKLALDDGRAVAEFAAGLAELDSRLGAAGADLAPLRARLAEAAGALAEATRWLRATWSTDANSAAAGATDYLRMFGLVACGQTMAESALVAARRMAAGDDAPFHRAKQTTARFYAERILPHAAALLGPITSGAATLGALDDDRF
jgi:hypothetical protein